MAEKEHVIIGTAGHIDHGKSALVRALTGTDPDTLPEEKLRGMTIELGFVFLDDPAYEKQIVFIDVPGHEKFIKTMAAGASSVDAALLVIAADEGISVQTREHFDILQLLGLRLGTIALTKSDLVDDARIAELTASVRHFVKGSFLESSPILPVSAMTGDGVKDVKKVLEDIGRKSGQRLDSGVFRMPVDRVFTMHGFGTIIAGTVLSGEVRTGDRITIYPEGFDVRIRGVQVHKAKKDISSIGKRTALNLQEVKKDALGRGQVAAASGSLVPTIRLDAKLDLLRSSDKDIKHRERIRLHIGTAEVIARLVMLEDKKIKPGSSGLVQFILESPTVALPGDRFVIRSFSPLLTIGGGIILDGNPGRHKRFNEQIISGLQQLAGTPREAVEQMFKQSSRSPQGAADIALKLGRSLAEVSGALDGLIHENCLIKIGPEKYIHRTVYAKLSDTLLSTIRKYFDANPQRLFMPYSDLRANFLKYSDSQTLKLLLDDLSQENKIIRKETEISLVGREASISPAEKEAASRIEAIFRSARFAAPLEEDVRQKLDLNPNLFKNIMRNLIQDEKLVRLTKKVTYHRETFDEARTIVMGFIERRGSITIAELRDRLNLSRKYAQAILEHFDETGLTRRVEDKHVLQKKTIS